MESLESWEKSFDVRFDKAFRMEQEHMDKWDKDWEGASFNARRDCLFEFGVYFFDECPYSLRFFHQLIVSESFCTCESCSDMDDTDSDDDLFKPAYVYDNGYPQPPPIRSKSSSSSDSGMSVDGGYNTPDSDENLEFQRSQFEEEYQEKQEEGLEQGTSFWWLQLYCSIFMSFIMELKTALFFVLVNWNYSERVLW